MNEQITNNKIETVHFPTGASLRKDTEKYHTFFNAKDWKPNEGLSIISGVNGSGKSQLLKYIKMTYSMNKDNSHLEDSNEAFIGKLKNNGNLLYIPHDYHPNAKINDYKSSASLFLKNMEDENFKNKFIPECMKYYKNIRNLSQRKIEISEEIQKIDHFKINPEQSFQYKVKQILINENDTLDLNDINGIESKVNQIALILLRDIQFSPNDLNSPISPFINAFRTYNNMKQEIVKFKCRAEDLIIDYFNNKPAEFSANKSEILSILSEEYKSKYVESRLFESWGSEKSPWDDINTQLAKFPFFKHIINYNEKTDRISFTDNIQPPTYIISFESLSSGEQVFLTILSWQYICRDYSTEANNNNQKVKFKPDILLLDEPDKHFDPKLCKIFYEAIKAVFVDQLNVQVIMSTHKIDTIALSNENELFTITRDSNNNIEIIATHKLLVLFRLTGNLREFTNYQLVVYAESRADALFFEGVYTTLMDQSKELRLKKKCSSWQKEGTIFDFIFSRRIQFSFMSVSDNQDGGGGCTKVINCISQDIASYKMKNKLRSTLYDDIALLGPFGIIDNDYDEKCDVSKIYTAEENIVNNPIENHRVVVLKRHSLENYICDPFILCSVIDIFSNIIENRFKQKDKIINILSNINNVIIEEKYDEIQNHLNSYFKIILSELQISLNKNTGKKITNILKKSTIEIIKNFTEDNLITDEVVKIHLENLEIEVKYPKVFLDVKGKFLAYALFGGKSPTDSLRDIIAKKIFEDGLKYIPVDLIEIYCKLTHAARSEVRKIIKPYKQKSYWSTKIKNYLIQESSNSPNSI